MPELYAKEQAFREKGLGTILGEVKGIFFRKDYCAFCSLICRRIEQLGESQTGRCRATSQFFCRTLVPESQEHAGTSNEHTTYRVIVLIQRGEPHPSLPGPGPFCKLWEDDR
jgi:hypothetical protein